MQVTRYDVSISYDYHGNVDTDSIWEDKDGDYVLYSDYAALEKE